MSTDADIDRIEYVKGNQGKWHVSTKIWGDNKLIMLCHAEISPNNRRYSKPKDIICEKCLKIAKD